VQNLHVWDSDGDTAQRIDTYLRERNSTFGLGGWGGGGGWQGRLVRQQQQQDSSGRLTAIGRGQFRGSARLPFRVGSRRMDVRHRKLSPLEAPHTGSQPILTVIYPRETSSRHHNRACRR